MELDRLGKYEIRGLLGKGAMGTVYDGWDPVISRRVAIKTVRLPDTADIDAQEELARFKREAQAAGRLTHPNIVGIFDYGETDQIAYIVMEFVQGRPLKAILDGGERLTVPQVARIMTEVLAGLSYSHARGVVHRDIKPANIMIVGEEEHGGAHAKIADFGIARIESSNLTQAGTIMGTPAYMSPEQFMGQTVDARTDIYSCGVLLFQLLTGERPFEGSMATIMHKVLNTSPPKPSDLAVTCPVALDGVVAKAMARRPEDRYPTAAAFSDAIKASLENPAPALPPGLDDLGSEATVVSTAAKPAGTRASVGPAPRPVPAAAPPAKSRVPMLAAAAGLAVVLAGGGAWFALSGSGAAPNPQTAQRTQSGGSGPQMEPAGPGTGSAQASAPQIPEPSPPPAAPAPAAPAPSVPGRAAAIQPSSPAPQPSAPALAPPGQTSGPAVTQVVPPVAPPPPMQEAPRRTASLPPSEPAQIAAPAPSSGPPPSSAAAIPPAPAAPATAPPAPVPSAPAPSAPVAAMPPLSTPAVSAPVMVQPPQAPPPQPVGSSATPAQPSPAITAGPALASAGFSPEALRRAVASAVQESSCAVVNGDLSRSGDGLDLHGVVGAGPPEQALLRNVRAAAPNAVLDWSVRTVSGPYCGALNLVHAYARPFGGAAGGLDVGLKDGRTDLLADDKIDIRTASPDFPSYLQVDYFASDGSVAHLRTAMQGSPMLPPRSTQSFLAGEAAPPFGTDLIVAIASSAPLFNKNQVLPDQVDAYVRELGSALDAAGRRHAKIAAGAVEVRTSPKP